MLECGHAWLLQMHNQQYQQMYCLSAGRWHNSHTALPSGLQRRAWVAELSCSCSGTHHFVPSAYPMITVLPSTIDSQLPDSDNAIQWDLRDNLIRFKSKQLVEPWKHAFVDLPPRLCVRCIRCDRSECCGSQGPS